MTDHPSYTRTHVKFFSGVRVKFKSDVMDGRKTAPADLVLTSSPPKGGG